MSGLRTVLEQKIRQRRQTLEEFAEYAETFAREHGESGTLSARHLQRLVSGRGQAGKPLGPVRPATARLLERIFGLSIDELLAPPPREHADCALSWRGNERLSDAFQWLDGYAGWRPTTSQDQVTSQVAISDGGELRDRDARRGRVARGRIAEAMAEYYRDGPPGYGFYRARCGTHTLATSVLTRPSWLDLSCSLTPDHERLRLVGVGVGSGVEGDDLAVRHAVDRLAEVATMDVCVAEAPIYRLLDLDIRPGAITGAVGLSSFVEYALTVDLLEGELIDALATGGETRRGTLLLRDRCLPDLGEALDFSGRLCAGGALALCAIARPADPYRGAADYALLVQERSGRVVNAAGRLSVIPKAFHQPLRDRRADASIRATLLREMEEELFGRSDVDSTVGEQRAAAPLHPDRLSEPLRWLLAEPDRLRMECTGFGVNLVSGNYEFASLIVIEDEEFWSRFGGQVEANWESAGLSLYSSLDRELTGELATHTSWSNEGLFALLQGFRRLSEVGGERVNLPAVELLDAAISG